MKTYKRSISLVLSFVLIITTLFSQTLITTKAAGTDDFGDRLGTTTGSGAGISRADTFSENWEGGLDLNKWEVAKQDTSYNSQFNVVDDPVEGSNQGNVIHVGYGGTWLIPTDNYWPSGELYGDLHTISFKLYLKDLWSPMGWDSSSTEVNEQSNYYMPAISIYGSFGEGTGSYKKMNYLSSTNFHNVFNRQDGVYSGGFWSHNYKVDTVNNQKSIGYYTADTWSVETYKLGFVTDNWIDVSINFKTGNMTYTDINGMTFSGSAPGTYYKYDKRLAIGQGISVPSRHKNYLLSEQERCTGYYIDDIKVTFREADYDVDEEATNVDVYFEGNVFLNPDETIALTGERLGSSVLSADIARLADDEVSLDNATYVPETHYDVYHNVDAYALWAEMKNKDYLTDEMSSTDEDGEFKILSRGKLSVNMVIPASYEKGMYALLLHPSNSSGSSELVIINNPRITNLMGNDGDFASSNGHIEISGENLSVQDDLSKVSAIIRDKDGNKLHLIQNTADKEYIYVDTTENNGVTNEHYMKISLEGLNLAKGDYQLMVHNGYGGDYGWSAPCSFKVVAKSDCQVWRDKGVFNVMDYGAVGDGKTNDTAAIQRAANAAAENGGGMLYFPGRSDDGVASYRITKGLILKENVSIVGDGKHVVTLQFDGYMKTTIDQTRYMISYEKNLEISDIQLKCATNYFENVIYQQKGKKGKLYLHNCQFDFNADAWRSDRFSGTLPAINGVSSSTAYNAQWSSITKRLISATNFTYFEWNNCKQNLSGMVNTRGTGADYVYLNEYYSTYNPPSATIAGFVTGGYMNQIGTNTLYRNMNIVDYGGNNSELFVCDGAAGESSTTLRYVDPAAYKTELSSIISSFTESQLAELETLVSENKDTLYYTSTATSAGKTIRVVNGEQGVGQLRIVKEVINFGGKRFIIIDSPFACKPNRNTQVTFGYENPHHTYVNGCLFENGSLVGCYGTAQDVVFANCTTKKVQNAFYMHLAYSMPRQWYMTFNNNTIENSSFVNNELSYTGNTFTMGGSGSTSGRGTALLGNRYSNNTIIGHTSLSFGCIGKEVDVWADSTTVEDIEIYHDSPIVGVSSNSYLNLYLRNIHQYTDADNKDLSETIWYSNLNLLKTGMNNGWIWTDLDLSMTSPKGDVNGDYFVSLPDLDAMRSYFVGKRSITTSKANLTGGDTIVDARDFLYLRAMILYKNDEEKLAEALAAIDAITASEGATYEEAEITIDYSGYSDDKD